MALHEARPDVVKAGNDGATNGATAVGRRKIVALGNAIQLDDLKEFVTLKPRRFEAIKAN